jgi:hypothetical protein
VSSISGAQIQYAGGGGGGRGIQPGTLGGGLGVAGGGTGSGDSAWATSGLANTGGGGGGGNGISAAPPPGRGGEGGSGIVIIRYPSYLLPAASTTGSPETYIAGQYRVYKFVANGTITF